MTARRPRESHRRSPSVPPLVRRNWATQEHHRLPAPPRTETFAHLMRSRGTGCRFRLDCRRRTEMPGVASRTSHLCTWFQLWGPSPMCRTNPHRGNQAPGRTRSTAVSCLAPTGHGALPATRAPTRQSRIQDSPTLLAIAFAYYPLPTKRSYAASRRGFAVVSACATWRLPLAGVITKTNESLIRIAGYARYCPCCGVSRCYRAESARVAARIRVYHQGDVCRLRHEVPLLRPRSVLPRVRFIRTIGKR